MDAAQVGKRVWAKVPTHERVRLLNRCADAIEEHLEDLSQNLSRKMGKIIQEARGEIRVSAQATPPPYINKNNCPLYRTGNPRKRIANHNRLW
ncbi:aldehyde dehydrogenase family protein [Fibrobacter sp. UWB15]|uniref:aldehyde dehydrogenase family protein n=1 Tax=unclassified Fibrobacter TaxID=2634177 RepID=UPI003515E25B